MNLKGWLLLISILIVFIGLVFVAGTTIKVPYTGMVTYSEKEPYTETVTYTVSDPYEGQEKYYEKEPNAIENCITRPFGYTILYHVGGPSVYVEGYITEYKDIKNLENEVGLFFIRAYYYDKLYHTSEDTKSYSIEDADLVSGLYGVTLNPYEEKELIMRTVLSDVSRSYWSKIVVTPPTLNQCTTETEYKDVEKTRTVTKYRDVEKKDIVVKYRDVEKTKPETKYETLWEALIGKNR